MIEDRVQNFDFATCNSSYNNLFNPKENSKLQDKARLNRRTIETLMTKKQTGQQ